MNTEPCEKKKASREEKEESVFRQEVRRDIETFRRLHGRRRLRFVYDYYRWKILGAVTILICLILAANILWQGHKPCRLRVCVVLNNEQYCTDWFDAFRKDLQSDGNKAAVEVNQDQPFDYDNIYYYIHELEVMTTVSSQRMDAAVCGPDMYSYLLSINACAPLDETLPADDFETWNTEGFTVRSTAGLIIREDGTTDDSKAAEGLFALDISGTAFGQRYNADQMLSDREQPAPLYFIIISNTEHTDDCVKLAEALMR